MLADDAVQREPVSPQILANGEIQEICENRPSQHPQRLLGTTGLLDEFPKESNRVLSDCEQGIYVDNRDDRILRVQIASLLATRPGFSR